MWIVIPLGSTVEAHPSPVTRDYPACLGRNPRTVVLQITWVFRVRLQYELDNDEFAPASARRAVDRDLGERIDGTRLGTVRMIVSELVTNSVVHGPAAEPIGLVVEVGDDGTLRGEVIDAGDRSKEPPGTNAEGDHSLSRLAVVGALADRWGIEGGSTHVWFELDAPPET
jgi:serine/threonine-protein kinase RsbW